MSGTVSGPVVSAVSIALKNLDTEATRTATTDDGGAFSFTGVPDGSYLLTASKAGYAFDPASRLVVVGGADVAGQDTTAMAVTGPLLTIGGSVSGAAKAAVLVSLQRVSGATSTTLTNEEGAFRFEGLADGTYIVAPSKAGFTFDPPNARINLAGTDVLDLSFTAAAGEGHAISGAITGAWVEGVTVTVAGASSAFAVTDRDGKYRLEGLRDGTYRVTPVLAGYKYEPPEPQVVLSGADAQRDFVASSAVAGRTLSGTVRYSGAMTGPIYVRVFSTKGGWGEGGWGGETVLSGPGAYQVRGLLPGSYVVQAWMDVYGMGEITHLVPSFSAEGSVDVTSDVTGFDIVLQEPGSLVAPAKPFDRPLVLPGNGCAVIAWTQCDSASSSAQLWWGTDPAASNGGHVELGWDDKTYAISGLTDGTAYYFKIVPMAGTIAGEASDVVGPITIGSGTGGLTLSGRVSVPDGIGGALYVGAYDQNRKGFVQRIENPTSSQPVSLSGLSAGSYTLFAAVDVNGNGRVDPGEPADDDDLTIGGNVSGVEWRLASKKTTVTTVGFGHKTPESEEYEAELSLDEEARRVRSVTVISGRGLPLPYDVGSALAKGVSVSFGDERPTGDDVYQVRVVYEDGTTETVSATLGAALDFARDLAVVTTAPFSPAEPLFTWKDPSALPPSFTYSIVVLAEEGRQLVWSFPDKDEGMPSTQHEVAFNVDDLSWVEPLVPGTTYRWQITVSDESGNASTRVVEYTPPSP